MHYQWHLRPYRRPFRQPVSTNHGLWAVREGLILRLVNEAGSIGWGEIAPIPWFGSETLEQALAFCHQLPSELTDDRIFAIPDALPSCQFGFESAWEGVRERAIDKTEPQNRRTAENQASFAPQNSELPPQNSELPPQSLAVRPQNLDIGALNLDVAALNSDVAALSSTLPPQNSELPPQSSELPPQSSIVAVQNSDVAVSNSIVAAQSSVLRPQNSNLDSLPTPHSPLPTPHSPLPTPHSLSPPSSALLPAGEAALHAWKALWEQGFRTFKWKIGVRPIATELAILHLLAQNLPETAKLRLDANGGLSTDDALQWLQVCDAMTADRNLPVTIEYIEQPLNISQFHAMQDLSQCYRTPIALDESVATLQQLQTCYADGWRGVYVIKPSIVGSPSRLRQFCQTHPIDAVFSSAFETAIGRQAGLRLAAALGNPDRAVGYGTTHWFDDAATNDFEQLWQTL